MSVLRTLIIKELRQFRRNPFLPKLVVGFPLAIVLILPWIANMDVKGVSVGIVDADRSDVSRRITSHVEASEYLRLHDLYADYPSALADLEDGHIDAILEIPNGFGHSLHATPKRLSIWTNGVNAMKGSLGSQYLMQTVMRAIPTESAPAQPSFESSEIVNSPLTSLKLLRSAEPASSLCSRSIATLSIVNYYNPTMDYKHFMIPALMIMLMVMVGGFLPALNLVSEKELGTIEQINVTPVSRLTFTLSKLIPFWVICLLELALCMTLALLVYGLPVAGSVGAIFLAALLFIIVMSSIGVIIANLSDTMQQTMFLMLFVVLSFILLSGLMTPVESMPFWAQHFTRLLPPTYMVEIMRAVYLRGTTVAELSGSYLALAAFALTFATLASFTYRKRG
ncbi:MAG: ABC transporter permease [Bacteroidaceae bacterium]|nr:ABC transporter permease [Bacteroidaceae bacterium]